MPPPDPTPAFRLPSPDAVHRLQRVAAPALRGLLRLRAEGREQVPARGPVLLAPNHRSFLDHFAVLAAAPRPVWFLGKTELARGPSGRLNLSFGMVPIDRGAADRDALAQIAELLARGEAVVVFPEGTRSATGELFRFRSGIARLAAECATPVVPVGLLGTAEVWPLGAAAPARRPRPGMVRVRFGAPLAPPGGNGSARRAFTQELWERVAALCEQERADRFAPIDPTRDLPQEAP